MINIISLEERPELIDICARWNHEQWGADFGFSLEYTVAALKDISGPHSRQAVKVALWNDVPAGMALLIDNDLDTHPHLTPWLASVYVTPEHRRHRLGAGLVKAVEQKASELGFAELYLYTDLPDYYRRLDWSDFEPLEGDNAGAMIMRRDI